MTTSNSNQITDELADAAQAVSLAADALFDQLRDLGYEGESSLEEFSSADERLDKALAAYKEAK